MKDYLFLPKKFHSTHNFCLFLIGQLEDIILKDDYSEIRSTTINLKNQPLEENEHILDYLLRNDRKDEHDRIIKQQLIIAVLTDICYFTQEALSCSLKKRLIVCFALLRKPFVYDLIILLRVIFENDFFEKFNNDSTFDPSKISNEGRLVLISDSLKCMLSLGLEANEINEWIFDKTHPDSLINISDRALHLSTTRNPNNITGAQNFNFVFSNEEDINSQWNYVYKKLPALIIYLVQVSDIFILENPEINRKIFENRLIERANFFSKNKQNK